MPAEWRERLRQPQSRGEVAALRRATQTECPLGQPDSVEELEAKFAVCLRPVPPGRPPKKLAQSDVAPTEIARHAGQPAQGQPAGEIAGGMALPYLNLHAFVAVTYCEIT